MIEIKGKEEIKKKIDDAKKIIEEVRRKINTIDFDAHWYRRAFHAFGASFLFYYLLPDEDWINSLKFFIPWIVLIFVIILEVLRLKGRISSDHFFGLRVYEKNRIGSYVFFGIGVLILLMLPWQAISIPCILCASLGDPIIGESRSRFGDRYACLIGFITCAFFFFVTWHTADLALALIVSIVGGVTAVIGETRKFWWIDDDFMVQILPAISTIIIFLIANYLGLSLPPDKIIIPAKIPW